jgi:cytoskeletal protein CcmA (bactofilin family)
MKPAEGSTVIGKSVTIRGELSGNEDLYMDGDMEGTVTLSDHALTIGPNARVLADVHAKDLVIFGSLTGNLHATGRIEIRSSAVVSGDIFGGRLSIEESATFKGKVNPGGSESGSDAPSAITNSGQANLLLEPKA